MAAFSPQECANYFRHAGYASLTSPKLAELLRWRIPVTVDEFVDALVVRQYARRDGNNGAREDEGLPRLMLLAKGHEPLQPLQILSVKPLL